jgi:hypothetical protein
MLLLIVGALTIGWQWRTDNRIQPPSTNRASASEAPLTGLAHSILEAESRPPSHNH